MASLAMAAFSAVSSAFATAAPVALTAAEGAAAVASAGAGAASWAAGTTVAAAPTLASSVLSGLQGVATIGGMISSIVSGIGGMQDANLQARMTTLEGESERLAAEEKALRIRREYVQKVGQTRVAFAGSGLDISGGYAIEDSLESQMDFETGLTIAAGRQAQAMAGLRASQMRSQGRTKLVSAAVKAATQGANFGLDIANRG